MYSLIIPVYNNAESLPALLTAIQSLQQKLDHHLEVIFVIDGSPDNSYAYLRDELPKVNFVSTLLTLSKNFGSFAAIRAGLAVAKGQYFTVMAADMQEPPQLIEDFFQALVNEEVDVVLGTREGRDDPFITRILSQSFWFCYRKLIQRDVPPGGVDVFGCNRKFRDCLLGLDESNSSLIGLIFWLGFRRKFIPYRRLPRLHGKSAWSFRRKLRYFSDSIFSFSDLPIRLLIGLGSVGLLTSMLFGIFIVLARLSHWIQLPGYATTLLVILFFTALNLLSLGIIGSYVWRAFENSKKRPQAVIMFTETFSEEK